MRGIHLRTDTLEEACRNLEFVAHHLGRVEGEPYEWKWIVLGLHAALQSTMVAALRDSAGINILPPRLRAKLVNALEGRGPRPKDHLDTFMNLYSGVQGKAIRKYGHSKRLDPTQAQDRSIKKLHEIRNEFVHFVPKHLSLEVSGLPEISADCVAMIRFLAFDCGNILWDEGKGGRMNAALSSIEKNLTSLEAAYNESTNPKVNQ